MSYSLYLHIPFCTHRCGYCDFNTYAGLENLIPDYVDALVAEVRGFSAGARRALPVHTVFFGGGTPSLLPVESVAKILSAIHESFDIAADAEITLEANPGTLTFDKLEGLKRIGVNRISFGVQSSNPEELRLLERGHDFLDVIDAVKWARLAGFENLSLDWIFGLPGQRLGSWQRNIELALSLQPEHLSLYALSIEHGTPFKGMSARGLLPLPEPDLAAEMYEWASERLAAEGFTQYEISNWARVVNGNLMTCRHNLQYWRNLPYVGFGAGAHGYVDGLRIANTLAPAAYIQRLKQSQHATWPRTAATAIAEPVNGSREMGETMMMGLRLVNEGISRDAFAARFGAPMETVYGKEIERLSKRQLLDSTGTALRLTKQGRLLGNQVFMEFV